MRAWEKLCPDCKGSRRVKILDELGLYDAECPTCHGTGVVPMTTAELIEEGAKRWSGVGLLQLVAIVAPDTNVYYGVRVGTRWVAKCEWDTPDDALRAALEAVQPTKEATDGK